jgi:predicted dehydrogenase
MATRLRIGIVGSGSAALAHANRLLTIEGVTLAGCADPDLSAADAFARRFSSESTPISSFADHNELIRQTSPDALAIFSPHPSHYRPAMDGLQAGCHLFIEKPLSTNVQEAVDIVGVARVRERKVAVGHHFRLLPSLVRAKAMIAEGAIGTLRMVTATLAQPWLESHRGPEHAWRFDPRFAGGGILADSGIQLVDALLWTTGQSADLVSAIQVRESSGLDLVTTASIRLSGGTLAGLAVSGVSPDSIFELVFQGETGRLRATDTMLVEERVDGQTVSIDLPEPVGSVDANFAAAVLDGFPLCCPAEDALNSVRLLEAIARSATIGQFVGLT